MENSWKCFMTMNEGWSIVLHKLSREGSVTSFKYDQVFSPPYNFLKQFILWTIWREEVDGTTVEWVRPVRPSGKGRKKAHAIFHMLGYFFFISSSSPVISLRHFMAVCTCLEFMFLCKRPNISFFHDRGHWTPTMSHHEGWGISK